MSGCNPYKDDSVDEAWMRQVLALAERGVGRTRPNPLVGALLVRDGLVLGSGWHRRYGGPHAEVNAVSDAYERGHADLREATLYVNLEPCCHYGKTPPCTELIIREGISRVYVGMADPNPLVAGKGIACLRAAGIEVYSPVLENDCLELNRVFVKFITTKLPFVTLKTALSMDGKIATAGGESRWISSAESRRDVHRLRGRSAAVLCGIGTVLADDPLLTARDCDLPPDFDATGQPWRVVLDSSLRLPPASRLVAGAKEVPVLVFYLPDANDPEREKRRQILEAAGCRVCEADPDPRTGLIDPRHVLRQLGGMNIDSVLVEAGGRLSWSFVQAGSVDRIRYYYAPLLVGGDGAPGALGGAGSPSLAAALRLVDVRTESCGPDFVVEATPCLRE